MIGRCEVVPPGDPGHQLTHTLFLGLRHLDIGDRAAFDTDEMVVMTGQPLRQLVPGRTLRREMVYRHSRVFEDGQRPVQRRKGNLGAEEVAQLGSRFGAWCLGQSAHNRSTTLGETDLVFEEMELNLSIKGRGCHITTLMIMILNIVITILNFKARMGVTALVLVGMLTLVACGTSNEGDGGGDGVSVVTTTTFWGDVAEQIVGDDGTVEVLMPVGSDPHDYQPSSGQAADLREADLVIANGLGLEEGLEDVLNAAADDGVNVYELAPDLDPLPFGEEDHAEEDHEEEDNEDEEHHHGDLNPHVWFDPIRVAGAAQAIADKLSEIEPDVDWQSRVDDYVSEMEDLDRQIADLVSTIPDEHRKLVTNHDAFGYFADRYGFEIIGVVIPGGSTLAEPSSAELAALVSTIQSEDVPAILAETIDPSVLADAVAAEVGEEIAVVELYTGSLGEEGSGADTLAGMLLTDAQRIADALS
jgi:zinc/manganese transport system substrate-binding protein